MSQKPRKGPLFLAIMMITVGVGWLPTAQGYGPGINWVDANAPVGSVVDRLDWLGLKRDIQELEP